MEFQSTKCTDFSEQLSTENLVTKMWE